MKKKIVTVLLVLFVAGGVASCINSPSDNSTKTTETQAETSTQAENISETEVQTEKETESESQAAKETKSQVPSEYTSALKSAETYSKHMHMSKSAHRHPAEPARRPRPWLRWSGHRPPEGCVFPPQPPAGPPGRHLPHWPAARQGKVPPAAGRLCERLHRQFHFQEG